jgi:hypothetical protein
VVFENKLLMRIFGPKWQEVAGYWRRLHNEERYNLYTLQNIVRVMRSRCMRLAGTCITLDKTRNAYEILAGEPERKRQP